MRADHEAESLAVFYGYISAELVGVIMWLTVGLGTRFCRPNPDQSSYRYYWLFINRAVGKS